MKRVKVCGINGACPLPGAGFADELDLEITLKNKGSILIKKYVKREFQVGCISSLERNG